ncbi:MAG: YebC/PmpR family DNA-binding transcriptional regulator [Myxococcales bacterium]|nr:YebC/PmpR family DNA-binding transcriptional regulator [Myxococcales bacterium]MCB9526759.1 YebC/PmpR family DNA-binding transcriptional regulator [Myxococcales bacterium]
MGRIFETRKATMFARYDRMAKAFTKAAREIAIAVKAGGDNVEYNPALRRAVQNARSVNMPKDRIEKAIKKALGETGPGYETTYFEGYAPHGVAVMVETATDNNTRTVANVRMHFNKGGGNMGTTGSVGFLFNRMGVFRLEAEGLEAEELELELIDHGLEELGESEDDEGNPILVLRCAFESFGELQNALDARKIEPKSSGVEFIPMTPVSLSDEQAQEVLDLIDRLEGDDDVQNVFHTLA